MEYKSSGKLFWIKMNRKLENIFMKMHTSTGIVPMNILQLMNLLLQIANIQETGQEKLRESKKQTAY